MRLITRLWASSHNTIHRGEKSNARFRAYRVVRIWNVRWRAIAMTGQCHDGEHLSDELVGHVWWNRSDLELTNTRRGVHQRSGAPTTSGCIVSPNPGPLQHEHRTGAESNAPTP